jgi:hypothetical protein
LTSDMVQDGEGGKGGVIWGQKQCEDKAHNLSNQVVVRKSVAAVGVVSFSSGGGLMVGVEGGKGGGKTKGLGQHSQGEGSFPALRVASSSSNAPGGGTLFPPVSSGACERFDQERGVGADVVRGIGRGTRMRSSSAEVRNQIKSNLFLKIIYSSASH